MTSEVDMSLYAPRGEIPNNSTWIYSQKRNSWHILDKLEEHPMSRVFPIMVTLCKSNVLLTGGSVELGEWRTLTDIWLFLGSTFKWQQATVAGGTVLLNPGPLDQAVSVHDKESPCACQEAILLFPCEKYALKSINWTVISELSCLEETKVYGWKQKVTHSILPPVSRSCMPVVTPESKEIVLTLIEGCLWYLTVDNLMWTHTAICIGLNRKFLLRSTDLKAVYLKESVTYVLLSAEDRKLLLFSLSKQTVSVFPIAGQIASTTDQPFVYSNVKSFAISETEIQVSGRGVDNVCGLQIWYLQNYTAIGVWVWTPITSSWRSPPAYSLFESSHYAVWRNKLYFLGSRSEGNYNYQLWSLDLLSMRWELIKQSKLSEEVPNVPSAYSNTNRFQSTATFFDDDKWLVGDTTLRLWIYEARYMYSWRQLETRNSPYPVREGYSIEAISLNCIVLFGGLSYLNSSQMLNDLWVFVYNQRAWKQIYSNETHPERPSPRHDHATVTVNSVMFVYGGQLNKVSCSVDLWAFYFENFTWDSVKAVNSGPPLQYLFGCKASLAASAAQLWISTDCSFSQSHLCDNPYELWTYVLSTKRWLHISSKNWGTREWLRKGINLPIGFWQGYLLNLKDLPMTLMSLKLGCPAGSASKDILVLPCIICGIGSYAAEGSEVCSNCPVGTTTATRESGKITDCSICTHNYCQHGNCFVTISNSIPVAACDCYPLFTGTYCQYATYYYVGLGIALFLIAMTTVGTFLLVFWRKRKLRERELRRQIEEMNGVWQISSNEVTMLEEIGKGASGSVWLATYRDMTVAMKMLLVPDDPEMSLEFAREITFMQTIRHPNIVLFLGAGRFHPEGQPFLIAEFMRRGSLRHVLDDEDNHLTDRRKIQFASDVAKGMHFLHSLTPPRLHRDLKSENLLVSQSWVVKVADFGLGRPANLGGRRSRSRIKPRNRLIQRKSLNIPLLSTENDMSLDGIGTARWCAPELSRRQRYDCSIDVYSFGIVLWEIWTRLLPFGQYRFAHAIADAVERGERPPLPDDCPPDYSNLMQACWHEDATRRPPFSDVVLSIENMEVEEIA
jgi:hypothetical protein